VTVSATGREAGGMTATPDTLFDRSMPARIGITALNLLLPGLGLIRLVRGSRVL